jgi:phosphoglycerate transport regulatory protein PgtC
MSVIWSRGWRLWIVLATLAPLMAQGGQVVVLTSFPEELTFIYKTAFEKKHPDIQVEVVNKNTNAAVAYLQSGDAGRRPDVFWASALDAFETLAHENVLEKLSADVGNPAVPDKMGDYPLNDPKGFYKGQALAGYGIMWNAQYVKLHKLPAPAEWSDLTKPIYFGHIAMSSPTRSGTTRMTIETILQGEGWERGWSQVLQIAGNCAEITERSFDVPDGVNRGKFGIGLVIDFFGLSAKYSGFPVEFVYPKMIAIVPASIALVTGGRNAVDAKKFINFTLSPEGQELLLLPQISRLPVLPQTYASRRMPQDFPNVFQVARESRVQFDANLSEFRFSVVAALFDQTITSSFKELKEAAKAIHYARRKLDRKVNPKAAALLKQAHDIAYSSVLDEAGAHNKEFVEMLKKKKEGQLSNQLIPYEERWGVKAKANYRRATALAKQAASMP